MIGDIFCTIILPIRSDSIMVKKNCSTSVRSLSNLHFGVDDVLFHCHFICYYFYPTKSVKNHYFEIVGYFILL